MSNHSKFAVRRGKCQTVFTTFRAAYTFWMAWPGGVLLEWDEWLGRWFPA